MVWADSVGVADLDWRVGAGAIDSTAASIWAIVSGSVIISQLTLNGPLGAADYTSQFQGYGPYTVGA